MGVFILISLLPATKKKMELCFACARTSVYTSGGVCFNQSEGSVRGVPLVCFMFWRTSDVDVTNQNTTVQEGCSGLF